MEPVRKMQKKHNKCGSTKNNVATSSQKIVEDKKKYAGDTRLIWKSSDKCGGNDTKTEL